MKTTKGKTIIRYASDFIRKKAFWKTSTLSTFACEFKEVLAITDNVSPFAAEHTPKRSTARNTETNTNVLVMTDSSTALQWLSCQRAAFIRCTGTTGRAGSSNCIHFCDIVFFVWDCVFWHTTGQVEKYTDVSSKNAQINQQNALSWMWNANSRLLSYSGTADYWINSFENNI